MEETIKNVAHNQKEMDKLLTEKKSPIYLCGEYFNIPKETRYTEFIGIGKITPVTEVYSEDLDYFYKQNNVFNNVKFDDLYLERYTLLITALNAPDTKTALNCYGKLAESGNIDGMIGIAKLYESDRFVKQDLKKAQEFYKKAINLGSHRAMYYLAVLYECYCKRPYEAFQLYEKAADLGNDLAKKVIDNAKKKGFHYGENN